MYKAQYHLPGTPPATLSPPPDIPPGPPVITLIEYDRSSFEQRKINSIDELLGCLDNRKISWINIDGLGDPEMLRRLGEHFGLHPLALEDALNTSQRPKIDEYDSYFFIVSQMVYLENQTQMVVEQVSMFLARNFLITIQEEPGQDVFDPVRHRIRMGRGYARGMRTDYLAYMLLDSMVDHFFPVLQSLGEGIETVEDQLLETPEQDSLRRLQEYRHLLLQMRRCAWPQRELVTALSRDESGLMSKQTKVFLRDCYDHAVQIIEAIESYRDLTTGIMDMYLSSLTMRTNEVMRVLTVISSIFIPLTFIVGLYGMNFKRMPELEQPWGYPAVLIFMGLTVAGMLYYFRRKKWL